MGDPFSMPGGERPGQQASANDLMALRQSLGFVVGTGAPILSADGMVFEPLHVTATLVGNPEAAVVTGEKGSPAQLPVHVSYMGHAGRKVVIDVPFVPNATVHYYLKKAKATAVRKRSACLVCGRRVGSSYVLRANEHILLQPTRGAMS